MNKALHFRNLRDWEQFHDPKNLAEAITIEAAELLENFLWLHPERSRKIKGKKLQNIKEEIADIFIFLLYLCNGLGVDLLKEAGNKIRKNSRKYPVNKARGSSRKYTEF